MDTSLQRRGPTGRIYTSSLVFGAFDRLPVDHECNRVLSLRDTVVWLACCNTGGRTRDDACGVSNILQDPRADIDVVRREVITI